VPNIDGSKLADAPNGIPGGKVQAGAILQSKLAAGASDVGVTSSESYSAGTKAANPGPTTIATAARTVLGGSVILLATCTVELTHTDTGLTAVSARIKRDGSAISTDVQASASGPGKRHRCALDDGLFRGHGTDGIEDLDVGGSAGEWERNGSHP